MVLYLKSHFFSKTNLQIDNMAETNLSAYANSCAEYLRTFVIGPIVQHLGSKGIQVTVEELSGVLQLPAARSPAMPAPAVPGMGFGGPVPHMAAAVAPTSGRKTTATSTPIPGRNCMYQFKRGENKGKYCGKDTAPGMDYCNACLKSRKGLSATAHGAMPGVAPGAGAIPGVPPGYSAPAPAAQAQAQGGSLSVVPYDESRGLFREPNHGFIVYQVSPGVIAVIGRLIESENRLVPLTEQEKVTAQAIGLVLADTPASAPSAAPAPAAAYAPAPAAPAPAAAYAPAPPAPATVPSAVPSAPAPVHSAVPQIPTAQPGLVPTGQPALPTIPPLGGSSQSSTPTISPVKTPETPQSGAGTPPGVPQIPSIPQINM